MTGNNGMINANFQIIFQIVHTGNPKLDEARRKREEKKIQRQRDLEVKRAARGPLKLGAKKL